MAKDRDGNTIKVGDTVEVIDGSGGEWFNDKLGKRFKVTIVDDDRFDESNALIAVEGSKSHQQFAYRFKKVVNRPLFEVGDVVSSSYPLNYSKSNPWEHLKNTKFTILKIAPRELDRENPNWYNVGGYEFPECDLTLIRKGNKMTKFKVGSTIRQRASTTVYTVLYADETGVLVTWDGTGPATRRSFIINRDLENYSEVVPDKWAFVFKDSYNKLTISTSTYPSEEEAKKSGRTLYGTTFVQVIKLETK